MEVRRASEVEEQADVEPRRAKVVVQLPLGVAMEAFGRFDLDNQSVVDDHVNSLAGDGDTRVLDRDFELSIDAVSALM